MSNLQNEVAMRMFLKTVPLGLLHEEIEARMESPEARIDFLEIAELMTGYPINSLVGKGRKRSLVYARHAAMSAARVVLSMTLVEIGIMFNRDHGTVIHAIRNSETSSEIAAMKQRVINAWQKAMGSNQENNPS